MASLPTVAPPTRLSRAVGLGFVAIGVTHFVVPKQFARIIPEEIPYKDFWVYATGVAEVAGGVQLCRRPTRRLGWLMVGLLLLVFPANVDMVLRPDPALPAAARWPLIARLPFQALFIWLVLRATRPPAG